MTTSKSSPQETEARVLEGVQIARDIESNVQREVERLKAAGIVPHLVTIQVGQNPATDLYIRNQKRRFTGLGIRFTHLNLDQDTDDDGIISHIHAFNENPTVTGLMVTLPLPGKRQAMAIQEQIRPQKDVEGVGPFNLGNLIYNRGQIGPCTALAVLEAVRHTGLKVEGSHAVIVGHSDIVGKPLTLCLLRDLATTTTCHIATRDLAEETRRADLLVVAVGKAGLIRGDMIKPGAVVIDIGINEVDGNANGEGKQIVGDVVFEEAVKKASWITPVPGGIGRITVAMLARNTVLCAAKQLD